MFATQGASASEIIPYCRRLWYTVITKPVKANGNTKYSMSWVFLKIPTAMMKTNGYIIMRCHQQRTHGVQCRISLKYKLPSVATSACAHAIYKTFFLSHNSMFFHHYGIYL